MRGLAHQPMPTLTDVIQQNLTAARLVSPDVVFAGVAINTAALAAAEAADMLAGFEADLGLPCVDPLCDGVSRIADALLV
jgi:uncharacterized NAD-dependent epimerase/dehydratase family protein